ncbi:glycosyltransferase family 2 protein [Segetibacter sp. 3557_3]|uniref:glycosyltransferase family 2 protein n=1 Tax=Segetibacter sp. 3557_3 TaxID=2547429 RepID=UPI001058C30C|nr:glycosyltransferase family 2 protein [Segetibacter sp. 3557_3]TDH18457.1 glycosyltransferase family 2 protein [Segetibacter sp. 3557_3]
MLMVSVIIPTKNRPVQLRRCLMSLMEQKRIELMAEIIIINDGSNQEYIREVAKSSITKKCLKLHEINNNQSKGSNTCRNQGAKLASSPILAFLDDDSFPDPYWLENVVEYTCRYGVITGRIMNAHERFRVIPYIRQQRYNLRQASLAESSKSTFFSGGNCAIKSELFNLVDGFDESLKIMSDNALLQKLKLYQQECYYIDNVRIHHLHDPSFLTAFRNAWNAGIVKVKTTNINRGWEIVSSCRQNISAFNAIPKGHLSRMKYFIVKFTNNLLQVAFHLSMLYAWKKKINE